MAESTDQVGTSRRTELGAGVWVMLMLGVLTFGEFLVGAIAPPWGQALLLVAAFKAILVIIYYMHIGRLFNSNSGSH